jgi:hypothetical protein
MNQCPKFYSKRRINLNFDSLKDMKNLIYFIFLYKTNFCYLIFLLTFNFYEAIYPDEVSSQLFFDAYIQREFVNIKISIT